jgi:hypothetical protein
MTFNEQNTIEQFVISKLTGQGSGGIGDSARFILPIDCLSGRTGFPELKTSPAN